MYLKIVSFLLILIISLNAKSNVLIKNIKKNGQIDVYIINNNLFDITLKYDAQIKTLISSQDLPIIKSIKANQRKKIASFYILKGKYLLKSNISYVIGNKNSIHNNSYLYRLPYELNTKQQVTQGFNGKFSHKGDSLYAVDFGLKIGTKIYASRGGIVINIKNDSSKSGNKKYIKDANFITIKHNDGTYGKYVHLKKDSVIVKKGQYVKRGELLALSGNTGYTNGPHLHFIVFKGKSYDSRQSIAIKFISKNGIIKEPIKGKRYIAVK